MYQSDNAKCALFPSFLLKQQQFIKNVIYLTHIILVLYYICYSNKIKLLKITKYAQGRNLQFNSNYIIAYEKMQQTLIMYIYVMPF